MLRRVADSIFWMSRYIERAENVARFVDVNQSLSLGGSPQWAPLIYASGDDAQYHELIGRQYTADSVLDFLLFDKRNPNSVLSCLVKARENARAIREVLSVPIWEAINRFYLGVRDASRSPGGILQHPDDFLQQIKRASHEVVGVTEATMSQDEAWHFARIGRMLERADKTSRILDVKYFVLLPDPSKVGSAFDVVQWGALLESTSGLHMYRRRFGRIAPQSVAEFLLLDPSFPRSVRFSVAQAEHSLQSICGRGAGVGAGPAQDRFLRLHVQLQQAQIQDILNHGLHEFIDGVQTRLNDIDGEIYRGFFEIQPPAQRQTQQQ